MENELLSWNVQFSADGLEDGLQIAFQGSARLSLMYSLFVGRNDLEMMEEELENDLKNL